MRVRVGDWKIESRSHKYTRGWWLVIFWDLRPLLGCDHEKQNSRVNIVKSDGAHQPFRSMLEKEVLGSFVAGFIENQT
ncbi:MAG: hypothetical protein DCC51_10995 [Anaerolineae bacterium]|nr:MAG: hypothetical protein DCC51_10995 [Anaerolineae bacterium]